MKRFAAFSIAVASLSLLAFQAAAQPATTFTDLGKLPKTSRLTSESLREWATRYYTEKAERDDEEQDIATQQEFDNDVAKSDAASQVAIKN